MGFTLVHVDHVIHVLAKFYPYGNQHHLIVRTWGVKTGGRPCFCQLHLEIPVPVLSFCYGPSWALTDEHLCKQRHPTQIF